MPVTLHKPNVLQAQPQGVALSQFDRSTRMIQGQDSAVRPGSGEGQGKHAAAGAPLEDVCPARQSMQRLFDEQFGFGAGRQDLGSQPDRKVQEFALAAKMGDRMAVLPTTNQRFAPRLLGWCQWPFRMREKPAAGAAQGMAPQPFGIGRRAVTAGSQSGTGFEQRLAEGERLSRHRPDRPVAWLGVLAAGDR